MKVTLSEILTIAAILLGPILAVQISKYIEKIRYKKARKLNLFQTLMRTRQNKLSLEHVQALNMIDIEFVNRTVLGISNTPKKYKAVTTAWKIYVDHLYDREYPKDRWKERTDTLFIDLLHKMSVALNYNFDEVLLKRQAYSPVAYGEIEDEQSKIRKGLIEIIEGKKAIKINTNLNNNIKSDDDVIG